MFTNNNQIARTYTHTRARARMHARTLSRARAYTPKPQALTFSFDVLCSQIYNLYCIHNGDEEAAPKKYIKIILIKNTHIPIFIVFIMAMNLPHLKKIIKKYKTQTHIVFIMAMN